MAREHRRFNDDLKIGPYSRLDWVGDPFALKQSMGNQFAGSQSREEIADCRLRGRPSRVFDVDDSLLGPIGDPGERHHERPMCIIDSLLHRNSPFCASFRRPDSGETRRAAISVSRPGKDRGHGQPQRVPISASLSRNPQRDYLERLANAEIGKTRPDRVGDVVRREMRVVLFRHAGIGVTKLLGDDGHRDAAHGELRGVGVS